MIETEKKIAEVEEFSPPEPLYQENVIRHLIRLASFIVIGLLGASVLQDYIPNYDFYNMLLIFSLILIFLVGIILAFLQLRWVNNNRNKSTNLGGTVAFFGLFLTLVSSVSSLIAIPLVVLMPLLGLGLLLTLIGFFAETTRIDEPLVFWFRANLEVIIRYIISGVGVFLVNWSILSIFVLFLVEGGILSISVFPGDLIGGFIIGGIGLGFVWGSWFHQINQTVWRYRVEIIRTIESSVGLGLILGGLIILFLFSDFLFYGLILGVVGLVIIYSDLYIFKVKVTSHFSKGFVIFGQVIASITGLILVIIGIIQATPEFFYSISYLILGFLLLYRIWLDNINYTVKRTVQTIVWFFRTYYREVITAVGVSFLALGSFLIEFTKMLNPLLMDVLVIDSFFGPIPLGLFLSGFAIGTAIWHIPDRHDYFRGMTTTLSIIVVLWGILLLGLLLTPPESTDILSYGISGFLIIMGICVNGWIWRTEIYQSVKSALLALKNAVVYTINATVQFLTNYYRELITIGTLSCMIYGLVITWNSIINPPYWPFLFLLVGYIVCVVIWRIPDRHDKFRGVTTTFSVAITLFGLFLLFSKYYQSINLLSIGLVVIGIVVNGTVWRDEIKQLGIKTTLTIKNTLIQTGQAIKNFFIATKDALIQAGRALIQFIDETLHTIWDRRIVIIRAFMTIGGSVLTLTSFLSLFGFYIVFLTWFKGFELLLLAFGLVSLYIAWLYQVNHFIKQSAVAIWNALVQTGHALYNFLRAVKNAVIEALHTIWLYRIVILRASATIIGPIMILSVPIIPLLVPPEAVLGIQLMLFILGFCVLYATWFHQVNQFVKQSAIAIWNALVQTGHALYNFLRAVKNAVIEALLTIWLYRIVILRTLATIIGLLMILSVAVVPILEISPKELEFGIQLILLIVGIGILYVAWFHQVNHFVKQSLLTIRDAIVQTAHTVHNFLVAAKNTIVAFFQYTWGHRIDILRAITTTIGGILVLAGLFSSSMNLDDFRLVFVLFGLILLYFAWIHHVNNFVKQSAITIHNAVIQAARAIKNFFVAVKDAIIQTFHAIVQFLKNTYHALVQFFQTYYIEIIRYSATIVGALSVIIGSLGTMGQNPVGLLLIVGGFIILYTAWFHQVNHIIRQSLLFLRNAIVSAVQAIIKFLTDVKNAIVQTFYSIGSFIKKAGIQLGQLFRAAIDLTIPIILVVLAISILFYGSIVLISGIIDPSGVQMSEIFFSIPILGDVLKFVAAIIQGEAYSENLLGVFADQVFLIPLGAALIVIGGIIFLFVSLKKESMRLQGFLNPRDSNKGDE